MVAEGGIDTRMSNDSLEGGMAAIEGREDREWGWAWLRFVWLWLGVIHRKEQAYGIYLVQGDGVVDFSPVRVLLVFFVLAFTPTLFFIATAG